MESVVNISAYKFVDLDDIDSLRPRLLAECQRLGLRGTVLLSPEGINLFLAGPRRAIDGIVGWLRADARFADLAPKESQSASRPFRRMLVKKKREIITMRHPMVRPAAGRAPSLPATTLKRWLDQGHDDAGRPVVMLDTRNAFEVEAGAFNACIDWNLKSFGDFPAALQAHAAALAGKTVVSYCTGGIRCEKAALLMRERGVENVWQLDGGILKYFEEVGGAHWQGNCFVFDEREGVQPDLSPVVTLPTAAG